MSETKSLKSQNMKWLIMLSTADLIVVLAFFVPGLSTSADLTALRNWRLVTTIIIPVVILLVVNVPSNKVKCMLVYWRAYGWLPGCEVFSKYGPADPRVNMDALRENVGPLPTDPRKQNELWYRLFKDVKAEPEIEDSHRNFLMYRDMAVLTLPLILLTPIFLHFAGAQLRALWFGAALFASQYVLTAISGRQRGIRFVTTVLALHSARRVTDAMIHETDRRRRLVAEWRNMIVAIAQQTDKPDEARRLLQLHPSFLSLEPLLADDARKAACGRTYTVMSGLVMPYPLHVIKMDIARIEREWRLEQ
jgi:hypothetical protein